MITVYEKQLELASTHLDKNNPKYELNFLYVDSENLVSTNTQAVSIVKHYGSLIDKDDLYIHNSIVNMALKIKAVTYVLDDNYIKCLDSRGVEMVTFSLNDGEIVDKSSYRFPDYKRIIPKEIKHSAPFLDASQIAGILAVNRIAIDSKQVPTFKGYDDKYNDCLLGSIGMNASSTPIIITNEDEAFTIVIMPLVLELPEFQNYLDDTDIDVGGKR